MPKMRVVRIKEVDWRRIQRHAASFEPFHMAVTRLLNSYEAYEEDHSGTQYLFRPEDKDYERARNRGWED